MLSLEMFSGLIGPCVGQIQGVRSSRIPMSLCPSAGTVWNISTSLGFFGDNSLFFVVVLLLMLCCQCSCAYVPFSVHNPVPLLSGSEVWLLQE